MPSPEQKQCPRCGTSFECETGSISRCQCKTVHLTPEQREYLSERYDDCLCLACLEALRSESGLV